MTEDDVYKANSELVRDVCRQYGKIIEREDREALASLGMVYAIRTYRRGISAFRPYAAICIRDILWFAEDNQRKVRRVEHPLSLDMRMKSGESSTTYVEMIAHPNSDYISSIITFDFMKSLEKGLQNVVRLCINNYTTTEIAEDMHISITEVEQLKNALCRKWKEYDKMG